MSGNEQSKVTGGASQDRDAPQQHGGRVFAAAWETMRQVWERFGRDGCSLMAAATAFYGLISLIPLGALAISVVGRVLGSSEAAHQQVQTLLSAVFPLDPAGIGEALREFSLPTGRWFVEGVSILGLLWAGSRLFHTLEDVLTRVWSGHGRGRPLFLRNVIALATTIVAGLIFLITMLATAFAATLASRGGAWGAIPWVAWWGPWLRAAGPVVAAWLMFMLMYVFLTQEKARWREAAIGAGAAAVMWEISRVGFAALVGQSAAYGRLYGSLAGTVVTILWIYLTATIMLIGAEIAVVLQKGGEAKGG
ncbi:MAG: YihY/virulence factor BrkB family protein [Proteobacteria bacterium]|nr:YihY/virulence factor BrkB family protein [Pseudomonadota bacterium]